MFSKEKTINICIKKTWGEIFKMTNSKWNWPKTHIICCLAGKSSASLVVRATVVQTTGCVSYSVCCLFPLWGYWPLLSDTRFFSSTLGGANSVGKDPWHWQPQNDEGWEAFAFWSSMVCVCPEAAWGETMVGVPALSLGVHIPFRGLCTVRKHSGIAE